MDRRIARRPLWLLSICVLFLALAAMPPARAAGLVVVEVDQLRLSDVFDTAHGPLTTDALNGGVVALVSPGLPRPKPDSYSNLYATLTAGDVADAYNPYNGLLQRQLIASGADRDVRFVPFGDVRAPGRMAALRALIFKLRAAHLGARAPGILLVGVVPWLPDGRLSGGWDSLTPIVWLSCGGGSTDASQQPTLTSDTTQTVGLIALRDVAPTILATENLPIPDSMSGHPARLVELGVGASRDDVLRRMDNLARLDQRTLAPFGWIFGLGGGAILLLSIWAILKPRPALAPLLRLLLRMVLATPVALMVAALAPAPSPYVYLTEIAAIALVIARILRLQWLLGGTSLALIADALCGTPLISRSVLSGYWLSGIRFYGIGNEYMGVILGVTLLWPYVGGPSPRAKRGRDTATAVLFAVVLFVLAYPAYGAKAGGAVTAMATFLLCWWAVARKKEPAFRVWCVSVVLGFASIFGLSVLAKHFGARPTHIQVATDAVLHGHLSYVKDLARRKAKMAVKIALSPGVLSGIAGATIVAVLWLRSGLRRRAVAMLTERPDLRRALISGLWGILAALLFNDSGAVAALLLFGCMAISLLHELLGETECVSSPSMSAMSASESLSATNSNSGLTPSSP
jgi:hypothetical protein